MKASLLQIDIKWKDELANIQEAERLILSHPGSLLYVLPEMWSTGFLTSPASQEIPTEDDSIALNWMHKMARKTGSAIAGSLAIREEDGTLRNRFYFITPTHIYHYDKRHLFTMGGEQKDYAAGKDRVVVEWQGIRFLLQVCYDLRFPVFARNQEDYDCILYVASWPVPRIAVWRTLLQARAIENQCYVMGANRIGSDPSCEYNGATTYVDAYGRSTEATEGEVQILDVEIDMDKLSRFRQKFPVLKDRD